MLSNFIKQITRLKKQGEEDLKKTKLARVLSTLDLTLLGVGSTMGVGVYVLAGHVSKNFAGPAVIISFFIAALASSFAGLCYAEFGARVPRAGSAYAYCYFTVGEFVAFIIGWNLILEYSIGAASVTKGLSSYIDELTGRHISTFLRELCPMNINFLGEYPDFFAFAIVLTVSVCLAFGVKESSWVNNICTGLNMSVVLFVVIAGSLNADVKNWQIKKEDIPDGVNGGEGGFAPFGVAGIIKAAAVCFYGFIGFDCIATTGEEAKTPQKSIPLAVIFSLSIIFLSYFSMSVVLNLMEPYYDMVNPKAPFTAAFDRIGWDFAKWIVSIGAILGLIPSLLGSLIPLPRVIYAMAADGLLLEYLGRVNHKFHSPLVGTLLSGFLTGIMALLFNLEQLVDMMSIGTLIAYTVVAACVLLLRYRKTEEDGNEDEPEERSSIDRFRQQIFNSHGMKKPTSYSSNFVTWMVLLFCTSTMALNVIVVFFGDHISNAKLPAVISFTILLIITSVIVISISMQPTSTSKPFFMVPLVPFIPSLSIFVNFYLALMLDVATWLRFGVWVIAGVLLYFTYGIRHSVERYKRKISSRSTKSTSTEIFKKK